MLCLFVCVCVGCVVRFVRVFGACVGVVCVCLMGCSEVFVLACESVVFMVLCGSGGVMGVCMCVLCCRVCVCVLFCRLCGCVCGAW